jgi:putative transposase
VEWFQHRREATVLIEQWRRHYNTVRPHSSLAYRTPQAFKTEMLVTTIGEGSSPVAIF